MKKICNIVFIIMMLLSASLLAQENISPGVSENDRIEIQDQVASLIGTTYEVTYIIRPDSAKDNRFVADGAITDPFGTLSNCFIFIASEPILDNIFSSHYVIGVYKNNSILWHSIIITKYSLCAKSSIYATLDLNTDGKVEIIASWYEGVKGDVERLCIFTWDGLSGTLINSVDDQNESVLLSKANMFENVDIDGNNIFEITGLWFQNESDENYRKIVYSWNGAQYGKWTSDPQPLPSGFYPRNNVDAAVKAVVKKQQDKFSYNYNLYNRITSKQKINELIFAIPPDSVSNNKCMKNWVMGGVPGKGFGWILLPGFHNFLSQGKSDSSFYFECKRLPAVVQCFIRGENGSRVPMNNDSVDYNLERWYGDVKDNSLKLITVAPKSLPYPFIPLDFLDTLTGYTNQSRTLGWIKDQTTADKYLGYFSSAKTNLQQNNIVATRSKLNQVLQDVNIDTVENITSEAYALLRYNTEYLLSQLPTAPVAGCNIKLINSTGSRLTGGTLQYYEGSWKDAVNNNDGTFFVNTTKTSLSLRMTYEYCTQTKSNVAVGLDTVVFQTVNAQIQLKNSGGILIDTGTVQYYAGAWRNFGTSVNGTASKELLPANYSFRMTYAYASKDKQQDLSANSTVIFQTVNAAVQLQNSQGSLIDQGTVQYYSGAWRSFGITSNGVANKELLPNNYSFRMTYAYASKDKQQDLNSNPTVVFQTINAAVQLKNSQGNLIDQGTVQYYSGAWRSFGTTSNGITNKELLPNNYSFRMTYEYASIDKQQDLSVNSTVDFSTVLCTIRVKNAQSQPIDGATASYYSGAWRQIGNTVNGEISKELLPINLSFRAKYGTKQQDKQQNLSANNIVEFVLP